MSIGTGTAVAIAIGAGTAAGQIYAAHKQGEAQQQATAAETDAAQQALDFQKQEYEYEKQRALEEQQYERQQADLRRQALTQQLSPYITLGQSSLGSLYGLVGQQAPGRTVTYNPNQFNNPTTMAPPGTGAGGGGTGTMAPSGTGGGGTIGPGVSAAGIANTIRGIGGIQATQDLQSGQNAAKLWTGLAQIPGQSWNIYSQIQNQPVTLVAPDGSTRSVTKAQADQLRALHPELKVQ